MKSHISGFPEFLPEAQIVFSEALQTIRESFELYGFSPLDTAAVEKVSTLLSKGNDNEIYGLHRLADENDKGGSSSKLGLRFDLTVPLARYVAENFGSITFPYKRYHIAPVWRGERAQAGRYRQFYQCDIDVIANGELNLIFDAEMPAIVYDIFRKMSIGKFTIYINNRNILVGYIRSLAGNEVDVNAVMRVLDKADKVSTDVLRSELSQWFDDNALEATFSLLGKRRSGTMSNNEWISYFRSLDLPSVDELAEVVQHMRSFGIEESYFSIDLLLARGLTYYTGSVYETKLDDYPELGSICSGGRYANLTGNFGRNGLPGVGISIGLTRLISQLLTIGRITPTRSTVAKVMVTSQDPELMGYYVKIANTLRNAKIKTDIFYQSTKSLSFQMKYAAQKGFEYVVIASSAEFATRSVIVRNMSSGEQTTVLVHEIISKIS